MKKSIVVLSILGLVCINLQIKAQLTPQEAIVQMGRGINIGNTLEAPNEGSWQPPVQEYYFDDYVDAGFTCVRIPITWDGHTSNTLPFTIDDSWLDRVEQIVDWALARKLLVVINAHHDDWVKDNPSQQNLDRFDSIWSQISVRFKDKSDSLLFEMINEPEPMPQNMVYSLNSRVLSIIRKTNPTRIVLFSGHSWANSDQLLVATVPVDNYLIAYFHSYDPYEFGLLGQGFWGSAGQIGEVKSRFDAVKTWSDLHNVPVFLGEFGAIASCDTNSRMKHYATYVEQSINHGFAFAVWDDGGNFRIYNRNNHTWKAMKDIIINYSSKHPTSFIIKNNNGDSVTLSWVNRTTSNDSIFIEKGTSIDTLIKIAALKADATTYTDNSVTRYKRYFYRVTAYFADSVDLVSYPQCVTTTYAPVVDTGGTTNVNISVMDSPVEVFPNPTPDEINIRMKNSHIIQKINLYNTEGRLIITESPMNTSLTVSLEKLNSGLYFLSIQTDRDLFTIKIKKQ